MLSTTSVNVAIQSLSTQIDARPTDEYCAEQDGVTYCLLEYELYDNNIREECEVNGGVYMEAFVSTLCELSVEEQLKYAATFMPFCYAEVCSQEVVNRKVEDQINFEVLRRFSDVETCSFQYIRVTGFESIYNGKDLCYEQSTAVSASEGVAAEIASLQNQISLIPLPEICEQDTSGVKECTLEYQELSTNLQEECEMAGGVYKEAFFKTTCADPESGMTTGAYVALNEPQCFGSSCDNTEATSLVVSEFLSKIPEQFLEQDIGVCTLSYLRVVEFESIYRMIDPEPIINPNGTDIIDVVTTPPRSEAPYQSWWYCWTYFVIPVMLLWLDFR